MIIEFIVGGALMVGGAIAGHFYGMKTKNKKSPAEFVSLIEMISPVEETVQEENNGITVVAVSKSPNRSNPDEHIKLLRHRFKEASDAWNKKVRGGIRVHPNGSRRVMRNILSCAVGEMTYKVTDYELKFSNGDVLWVANKYYSFGNITQSTCNLRFDADTFILDEYTFLRVVELIHDKGIDNFEEHYV